MALDYSKFVAMAQKGVGNAGRMVSLQKLSDNPVDPDKPWKVMDQTPTESILAMAAFVPVSSASKLGIDTINADLLSRIEMVALIAPIDGVDLSKYQIIVDGMTKFVVHWAQTLQPGPVPVLYAFGVKR